VKPVAVRAAATPHDDWACVKNDVPVVVMVTVTVLLVHGFAAIDVAVVNMSTGLTPVVPDTRDAHGIDKDTCETRPIDDWMASLAEQVWESLEVEIFIPFDES